MCGNQSEYIYEACCVRHMIRTLSCDLLPGFDPFVRVCIAGGDENERRHAAVTEGAGYGCSPDMGHGSRQEGVSG